MLICRRMSAVVDKIVTGGDLTFHLEFERDEESGWFTVHVTELPGCVSQGATRDEAKVNIADAFEACMEVLLSTPSEARLRLRRRAWEKARK